MAVKTVKVKNVDKLLKDVDNLLEESTKSLKVLSVAGKFLKDRIYSMTKAGKSIPLGQKLRSLSDIYIDFRKEYVKAGGLTGDLFNVNRSNLTLTGQMLDALAFKIDRPKGEITIFVKDTLRKNGLPGENYWNSDIAKLVAESGRPFIGVDEKGKKRLKQLIVEDIRRRAKSKGFTK